MDSNNRPLLPKPTGHNSQLPGLTLAGTPDLKRKRVNVRVACNPCRSRKSACDGQRPVCSACETRGSQCVYNSIDRNETSGEALKRQVKELQHDLRDQKELLTYLTTCPTSEAVAFLRQLSTTSNSSSVLSSLQRSTTVGQHASDHVASELSLPTSTDVEPEATRSSRKKRSKASSANADGFLETPSRTLEDLIDDLRSLPEAASQDLLRRWQTLSDSAGILRLHRPSEQTAAQAILPPIFSKQEFELFVRHPAAYILSDPKDDQALVERAMSLIKSTDSSAKSTVYKQDQSPPPQPLNAVSTSSNTDFLSLHVPLPDHYEDLQLYNAEIRAWTNVEISNELAVGAISLYLREHHPILGLFDAQLFVDDLINRQHRFCSPFLVSSLLAFALQSFGSIQVDALQKSYELEVEAEGSWRIYVNRSPGSIVTVSGLILLYHSLACHGRTGDGLKYIDAMVQMARALRLFGGQNPATIDDLSCYTNQEQCAVIHTAWGAFNITTMLTHFQLCDFIEIPPLLPIPERSSKPWMWQKSENKTMNETFPLFCKLWTVMSQVMAKYRREKDASSIPMSYPLSMYGSLLDIVDNIPKNLLRVDTSPGHVLVFHIWYHAACLDIFRRFLQDKDQHAFRSWVPSAISSNAIFAASVKQLRRLILEVLDKPGLASCQLFWHIALMYVANAALNDVQNPESSIDFSLCMRGYQALYTVYPLFEGIVQGLLAMAINKGMITKAAARVYIEQLYASGRHPKPSRRVDGGYILDFDLAMADDDAGKVDKLMDQFEQITIFEEFTDNG